MSPDDLIAAIKEMSPAHTQSVLAALNERVPGAIQAWKGLASASPAEEPLEILRVDKFLQHYGVPPPMLVDRLIPENSLVLMAGKPKAGKSLAALDLLNAVCRGLPVFGEFKVARPGPVFYLGLEDGGPEICRRIVYRSIARPGDVPEFYAASGYVNLSRPESLETLWALLAEINPVLICIDTAREALGVKDWTNPGEVVEKVRPMRNFARKHCSVLLVAHNRKMNDPLSDSGDEISGSNAFGGAVDGWISGYKMEKLANRNRRVWWNVDGRGGMDSLQFVTEMSTIDCSWTTMSEDEVKEAEEKAALAGNERYQTVAGAIYELDNKATVAQVVERTGMKYPTVYGIVQDMVRKKLLNDTGEKQAAPGKGKPAAYFEVTSDYLYFLTPPLGNRPQNKDNKAPESPAVDSFFSEDDGEDI